MIDQHSDKPGRWTRLQSMAEQEILFVIKSVREASYQAAGMSAEGSPRGLTEYVVEVSPQFICLQGG